MILIGHIYIHIEAYILWVIKIVLWKCERCENTTIQLTDYLQLVRLTVWLTVCTLELWNNYVCCCRTQLQLSHCRIVASLKMKLSHLMTPFTVRICPTTPRSPCTANSHNYRQCCCCCCCQLRDSPGNSFGFNYNWWSRFGPSDGRWLGFAMVKSRMHSTAFRGWKCWRQRQITLMTVNATMAIKTTTKAYAASTLLWWLCAPSPVTSQKLNA